jgi:16S rRNA pseudouridine516 synthase
MKINGIINHYEIGDRMRLDKLLVELKFGSRKDIKQIVKNKQVTVNDGVVRDSSVHVDPINDVITVFGETIHYKPFFYFMLNKPAGYLSATKDGLHKTVLELLSEDDQKRDVFPCGRLDLDTEGLVILSNDGQFAHQLLHPKKEIYKTYYVEVDGMITEEDQAAFLNGMEILDGQNNPYVTKTAYLEILSPTSAHVSICEGKFHQIKRMFQACDKRVTYLKRLAMGKLKLDPELALGEYREIMEDELALLFENEDKFMN